MTEDQLKCIRNRHADLKPGDIAAELLGHLRRDGELVAFQSVL